MERLTASTKHLSSERVYAKKRPARAAAVNRQIVSKQVTFWPLKHPHRRKCTDSDKRDKRLNRKVHKTPKKKENQKKKKRIRKKSDESKSRQSWKCYLWHSLTSSTLPRRRTKDNSANSRKAEGKEPINRTDWFSTSASASLQKSSRAKRICNTALM